MDLLLRMSETITVLTAARVDHDLVLGLPGKGNMFNRGWMEDVGIDGIGQEAHAPSETAIPP